MFVIEAARAFTSKASLPVALYVAIGLLFSQLMHIHSYHSRGGAKLMTWFKSFGLSNREPSIMLVSQLCIIMAVVVFLGLQLFVGRALESNSRVVLVRGTLLLVCACLVSQVMFSSIMRLSYESLFCFVALASVVLKLTFVDAVPNDVTSSSPEYLELWDLLKFVTPICLGMPILMGGGGFITSFYQTEQVMVRLQLYRHIAMVVYFGVGAATLIVYPILRQILIIRGR